MELAAGLTQRGHQVEIMAYDGEGGFDAWARQKGVKLRYRKGGRRIDKIANVRHWLHTYKPDVVHGIMKRASSLAVLTNMPVKKSRIVASDMSTATYNHRTAVFLGSVLLFHFADRIVTQTEVNKKNLIRFAPTLKKRIVVVRNGVDTTRFEPQPGPGIERPDEFRFLSVGTVYQAKNPVNVVEALRILKERTARSFRFDWVGAKGHRGQHSPDYTEARRRVEKYGLEELVRFHEPVEKIEKAYRNADALVHVSLRDGIPNAVVEGMASGLPIIVSNISDLPIIIQHAQNGVVCDPLKPSEIADAMLKILNMDNETRHSLGKKSRRIAQEWFGKDRYVDDFEKLYQRILKR